MSPDRHHRFLGNRAFVLDGMLTDARENGLVSSAVTESCNSDNSEVIAASSECSLAQCGGSGGATPGLALGR